MSHTEALGRRTRPGGAETARGWSWSRVAGGLVLAAWAFLFWFLQISGRVNLYLSTRTSWVVPIGAVLLTLAAVGRSEERRVGKECRIRCRSRWSPYH